MLLQPYLIDELQFAFCYRVYCRWGTYRARPQPALRNLTQETLHSMLESYGIRILEASASETGVMLLASLLPSETVAGFVSKTKGRVSKWLREQIGLLQPAKDKFLRRGYFACTTGQSAARAVDRYLEGQGDHHGYLCGARPPVFVRRHALAPAEEERLGAKHAVIALRFHVVLSTWRRKGVFGRAAAEAVSDRWRQSQEACAMALEKVSFLPDHVHVAVRTHPGLSPAKIVVALMNGAQDLMWRDFPNSAIQAPAARLWQPSAYVGSYGDLESAKIASSMGTEGGGAAVAASVTIPRTSRGHSSRGHAGRWRSSWNNTARNCRSANRNNNSPGNRNNNLGFRVWRARRRVEHVRRTGPSPVPSAVSV